MPTRPARPRPTGVALALSRLGFHVSRRFAERVGELDLRPSDAATLRVIGEVGPSSQRELAGVLGLGPSRLVALVDGLEERGLVERAPNPSDRRRHDVTLTEQGRDVLGRLRGVFAEHDAEVVADLTDEEVAQLLGLLGRLQRAAGIQEEGHPGMGSAGPA